MKARQTDWLVALSVALLALLVVVLPALGAAEEGQNVEPRVGYSGQRFAFFASGFRSDEPVGFWATKPDGTVTTEGEGEVVANGDGRADWSWVAPGDAPAGTWLIAAQGVKSGTLRTLQISVLGPDGVLPPAPQPEAPPPGEAPVVSPPGTFIPPGFSLGPSEFTVYAGETIRFSGAGFAEGERVTGWATAPDMAVIGSPATAARGAEGRAEVSITLPQRAIGGRWAFTLKGDASNAPVTVGFYVAAVEPPTTESQAAVNPGSAAPGTVFSFVATGFRNGEKVGYWVTDPSGRVFTGEGLADEGADDTAVQADGSGLVRVKWQLPSWGAPGIWVMTFQGVESGIARGIPFEAR